MCFLPCFLHKQKTSRPPGRDRASSAACGTPLKKGKVLHRCTKRTPARGRTPRQAGRPGPIGHSVVGFCSTARGEWAGPVWAKNRSRRAVTCVSLPPSQRRAPFRGIHKGASPLCVLFTLLFAQAKNKPSARTGPGIPAPLAAHLSKKVRCCTAAQKDPPRGGGYPASRCRLRHTSQKR